MMYPEFGKMFGYMFAKQVVECCDSCKRPFEKFKGDTGEDGWSFVPDDNGDLEYLMSNLENAFFVCTVEKPERIENEKYFCIKCVEAIGEDNANAVERK